MNKPEALRLARELEACPTISYKTHATELRRLHSENEALTNVANRGGHIAVAMSRIADLEAQRDALLEALTVILNNNDCLTGERLARAAIKAVEETK